MVKRRGIAYRELVSAIITFVLLSGPLTSLGGAASNTDDLKGSFPPLLVYPTDNSWINTSTPTLQWRFIPEDPTDSQTGFTVQVDDNVMFGSIDRTSGDVLSGAETWTVSPPLPGGSWHWRVRVRDRNGDWSAYSAPRKFNTDLSPPNTTLTIGEPSWYIGGTTYVSSETKLTLSVVDGGIGVLRSLYRIWNGTWSPWQQYTDPFILDRPGESQTIEFYSIDKLWNVEGVNNFTLRLDDTPPDSTIRIVGQHSDVGGEYYIGPLTELAVEATDGGAGVNSSQYRIGDGMWVNYTAPVTLEGMAGMITIGYRSIDNVGNVELGKYSTLFMDVKPPHTELTIGPPNYGSDPVYVNSSTLFGLTSNDDITAVESKWFKIDTGNWTRFSVDFTIEVEGQHVIFYSSTDVVGNKEATSLRKIYVDDTPPTTIVNFDGPHLVVANSTYISSGTVISLISSDEGSGVKAITYIIDKAVNPPYTRPFRIKGSGAHTLKFNAIDRLMNREAENIISITVDDEPPVTALTMVPSGSGPEPIRIVLGTEFTLSTTDTVSGCAATFYRIDNGSWIEYTVPFILDDYAQGLHTVHYYSVDNLGNAEESRWVIVSTEQQVTTGSIVGKVVAGAGPLANVTIAVGTNLSVVTDSSGSFTCPGLQPGAHMITAIKHGYGNRTVEVVVEAGAITVVFMVMMEEEPPPPPFPPLENESESVHLPALYIGLVVVGVIATVMLSLFLMRRRKKLGPDGKEWLNNLENGIEDVVESPEND